MSVVVVNHQTPAHLERCLESVYDESPAGVVVADTSPDPSATRQVLERFPATRPLELPNRGYGPALNAGLALTDTPYALLLNADTRVRSDAMRSLADFLDAHPVAAVAGPLIVRPDGRRERSAFRFPTPGVVLLQESGLHRLLADEATIRHADWVLGAALAVRKAAVEAVGGFDEAFFLYNEEVDLCVRLKRAGWDVLYAPVATVEHVGGASTSGPGARVTRTRSYVASLLLLYRRHRRGSDERRVRAVLRTAAAARRARARLQRAVGRVEEAVVDESVARGIVEALRGSPTPEASEPARSAT